MISKNKIKFIHSLALKKHRDQEGVFVAEGRKLVSDLLPYFTPVYLAATREWISANSKLSEYFPDEYDVITDDELRRASLQETPQNVIAVFRQNNAGNDILSSAQTDLCIMLDGVQNPGNLGTIVRIADWFGIRHIYCSPSTADIYNPKTVQATMGSMARVAVHYCNLDDALLKVRQYNASENSDTQIPVYGTFLDAPSLYDAPLSVNGILIMGNEGNGISSSIASYITHRLFIPSYPGMQQTAESLNVAVATAIVCAEFRRPR